MEQYCKIWNCFLSQAMTEQQNKWVSLVVNRLVDSQTGYKTRQSGWPWEGCRSRSSGQSVLLCRLCSSWAAQQEASRPDLADALLTHRHINQLILKASIQIIMIPKTEDWISLNCQHLHSYEFMRLTAADVDLIQGVFWRGKHPHVWSELLR